ncbi:MAG: T9SS type A sorting domain-containing protein [Bacteroidia bacterium]
MRTLLPFCITTLVALIFAFPAFAQDVDYSWAHGFGDERSESEKAHSVVTDHNGNVYITGEFDRRVSFSTGEINPVISAGEYDVFLVKYDSTGKCLWTQSMGGRLNDRGMALAVDSANNIYVTGFFQDTADFATPYDTAKLASFDSSDVFIAKYNSSGQHQWARSIRGPGEGMGKSIVVGNSGDLYISGSFTDSLMFNPAGSTAEIKSAGGIDFFIAKYDTSGNYIWSKGIGGANDDFAQSMVVDPRGYLYLTGYFEGITDFDPGSTTANLSASGSTDIFLAKYDTAGNYVWAKRLGGTSQAKGESLAFDGQYLYVTGEFQDSVDFDPSPNTFNIYVYSDKFWNSFMFLAKYDTSGAFVLAKAVGEGNDAYCSGQDVVTDSVGNFYIIGRFGNTVDFDPSVGTAIHTAAGYETVFVAKYDSSGIYQWVSIVYQGGTTYEQSIAFDGTDRIFITGTQSGSAYFPNAGIIRGKISSVFVGKCSSASGDFNSAWGVEEHTGDASVGRAIISDTQGNVYVAGEFSGTVDFDPSVERYNLFSKGAADAFLAKYDSRGQLKWAASMGGIRADYAVNVQLDDSGNVYIAGCFEDTVDFDPSPALDTMTADGGDKVFITKFDSSGNYKWSIKLGGSAGLGYTRRILGFVIDENNDLYISDEFINTKDFDPSFATANLTAWGGRALFFAKYNNQGQYQWARQIGNNRIYLQTLMADSSGIYLTGDYSGSIDFDPSANTARDTANSLDIFIAKYDKSGNYKWVKTIGGVNMDDLFATALGVNSDIYMYGVFIDSTDLDPSPAIAPLYAPGGSAFLAKYDSTGTYQWGKSMGLGYVNNGLKTDAMDNIFITSGIEGTVDFDPSGDSAIFSSKGGYADIYLAKYNSSGNYLWVKIMSGPNASRGTTLSLNSQNDVSITGILNGLGADTVDFDPSPSTAYVFDGSMFVAHYTNCGTYADIMVMGCDSFISPSNKYIWTATGLYSDTLQNAVGCDSVITVHLTIIPHDTNAISPTTCDSFVSPSGKYVWKTNGIYSDTLLSSWGCDSIITVNLTINRTTDSNIFISTCDSVVSPSGRYVWNQSGTYSDTLQNSMGCDSVLVVMLAVKSISYSNISPMACDSFISPSGRFTWKSSGNYTDTIPNAQGCDSIIAIGLAINTSSMDTFNTSACDSFFWPVTGITYSASDTLSAVLKNATGCDSIIKLFLTVKKSTFSSINTVVCDSFASPSGRYIWTSNGTYMDTIPNATGCDSVITVNLTLDNDCVWPGDANSDGVANNFDILTIGTQYSKTGPARTNASISWAAQHAPDWSDTLANGTNIKHADCDGDATISASDTIAVSVNYNKSHNKRGLSKLGGPDDPLLTVKFQQDSLTAGALMTAEIHLGSDILEAEDIYGIAYTVSVTEEFIVPNSFLLFYQNSWLGNVGSELISLTKYFDANSEVETGISRINHSNVSGSGKIGVIQFRLKDPLPQTALSHLKVELKDVLLINATETPLPYNLEGDSIRFVTGIAKTYIYNRVVIYPNPTKDEVSVNFTGLHVNEIQILDLRGRTMLVKKLRSADFTVEGKEVLNTSNLAAGVYLVKIIAEEGVIQRRVVKLNTAHR